MDEFNQDFNFKNDNDSAEETRKEQFSENFDTVNESQADIENDNGNADDFSQDDSPVWNKVNYTPATPIENYKPMSKGL